MSDVYFVNYSSGSFIRNRRWNNLFIRLFVRPKALLSLTDDDLKKSSIYSANRAVLDSPRGGGYWAWKPWAILQAFDVANEGDVIIYQDCGKGGRFKNILKPRKMIEFALAHGQCAGVEIPEVGMNKFWTKRKCFELMCCNEEKYKNANQVEATTSFWVVNEGNKSIITEWLTYCIDYNVVSDSDDLETEIQGFVEHRHDQSILTNIAVKYKLSYLRQNEELDNLFKSIWIQELFSRRKERLCFLLWVTVKKISQMRRR